MTEQMTQHPPRDDNETTTPTQHPPRDDNETTTPTQPCPVCATPFARVRRQAYCSPRCRHTAWRRRHANAAPVIPPPTGGRRAGTVYACTDCDTRYLGEQWCHDCNRPCTRIDRGGLCPHCDEPVTVDELINITLTRPTPRVALDGKDN